MARVNIENVKSTILEGSYYEALATTALDTKKIDGETVVTENVDVFVVTTAQITVDDLCDVIDSRLIKREDFAIRLHALALAINEKTTNRQLYDALMHYNCHPAFVSVVIEVGKKALIDMIEICKRFEEYDYEKETLYDMALCDAAEENKLEVMEILKEFGATQYHWALGSAAEKGQLEAIELIKKWRAAADADKLLSEWGAKARAEDN